MQQAGQTPVPGKAGMLMVRKEEFFYDSRDMITKIHAVKWIPEQTPLGIIQIIHGMAEYVERYEDFAVDMAGRGFLVVGQDHLGHGKSISKDGQIGYFCKRDAATVLVRDVHRLKKIIQEENPGVPYVILGHSMGSFILRNYLCRYGTGIQGAVIVGTGMPPKNFAAFSKLLTRVALLVQNPRHRALTLNKLSFGKYNQRIEPAETDSDWLCTDRAVVNAYIEDPLCGEIFTVNAFAALAELISRLYKKENLFLMPKDLPVLFLAGTEDPVGDYGEGVRRAYQSFVDTGMQEVSMKLYDGDRHEILNETDKHEVYQDIYDWIKQKGLVN